MAGLALVDRGTAGALARAVIGLALPCFAVLTYAIWAFVDEGGRNPARLGWSSVLVLVPALVAAAARLLASAPPLVRLANACAALAGTSAAVSISAIWDHPGNTYGKVIAAVWILTALAFFLVPVLQRWSSVGGTGTEARVLASLDDVELVASRGPVEGVRVEARLRAGERLVLRRR